MHLQGNQEGWQLPVDSCVLVDSYNPQETVKDLGQRGLDWYLLRSLVKDRRILCVSRFFFFKFTLPHVSRRYGEDVGGKVVYNCPTWGTCSIVKLKNNIKKKKVWIRDYDIFSHMGSWGKPKLQSFHYSKAYTDCIKWSTILPFLVQDLNNLIDKAQDLNFEGETIHDVPVGIMDLVPQSSD